MATVKSLQKLGNSQALILSKEMLAHLGAAGSVEVTMESEGKIVIRRAKSFDEAVNDGLNKFDSALRNLAK
jgi:antitoxin component of MazEF toxin-antitoxin module